MANNYAHEVKSVKFALERLLPLMIEEDKVSPQACYAMQHALNWLELCENTLNARGEEEVSPEVCHAVQQTLNWLELCENTLNASNADTVCPFCKAEFFLHESSIACPVCGYAVDNWIGDEEFDADLTSL